MTDNAADKGLDWGNEAPVAAFHVEVTKSVYDPNGWLRYLARFGLTAADVRVLERGLV